MLYFLSNIYPMAKWDISSITSTEMSIFWYQAIAPHFMTRGTHQLVVFDSNKVINGVPTWRNKLQHSSSRFDGYNFSHTPVLRFCFDSFTSFGAPFWWRPIAALLQDRGNRSSDPSCIKHKSKRSQNIKFYSKRPLVNVCYPCVGQFHNESPRRITYSEIHDQNINYLPTIQYSIRDCKIRQIIALIANRDSRYCGSAIGSRRTVLCGINNLIIRNTEFTIRCFVPFIWFVFNMSIWFSYYCRIGQPATAEFSPSETRAYVDRSRLLLSGR